MRGASPGTKFRGPFLLNLQMARRGDELTGPQSVGHSSFLRELLRQRPAESSPLDNGNGISLSYRHAAAKERWTVRGWLTGLAAVGASLLGVVFVVFAFALVNGGYVYKVECPRAGGSTETEWTYRWNSVIPYIAYSRSGCETHSATRVALDSIGVWKLDGSDSSGPAEDHSAEYPAKVVEASIAGCVRTGESRSFCECASDEITTRLSAEQFNELATAMNSGAESYEDFPESIRDDVRDAVAASERDCR